MSQSEYAKLVSTLPPAILDELRGRLKKGSRISFEDREGMVSYIFHQKGMEYATVQTWECDFDCDDRFRVAIKELIPLPSIGQLIEMLGDKFLNLGRTDGEGIPGGYTFFEVAVSTPFKCWQSTSPQIALLKAWMYTQGFEYKEGKWSKK